MTERALAALLATILAPAIAADPVSWSPASDYGVLRGHCDSVAVGAALANSREEVATLVGTALPRDMDPRDRACAGQALELTGRRRTVTWTNGATGVRHRVTPTRSFRRGGTRCRDFVAVAVSSGRVRELRGAACRSGDGEWAILG